MTFYQIYLISARHRAPYIVYSHCVGLYSAAVWVWLPPTGEGTEVQQGGEFDWGHSSHHSMLPPIERFGKI